jgi:hypothetical protein
MSWVRGRFKESRVLHVGRGVSSQHSSAGRLAGGSQGGKSLKDMESVASAAAGELEGGVRSVNFPVWRAIWVHRAVLAVVVAAGLFVEFNLAQFLDAYARWPQTKTPDLSSHLSTWDAAHYLILSRDGYTAGSHSCAFYPLWPAALALGPFSLAAGVMNAARIGLDSSQGWLFTSWGACAGSVGIITACGRSGSVRLAVRPRPSPECAGYDSGAVPGRGAAAVRHDDVLTRARGWAAIHRDLGHCEAGRCADSSTQGPGWGIG